PSFIADFQVDPHEIAGFDLTAGAARWKKGTFINPIGNVAVVNPGTGTTFSAAVQKGDWVTFHVSNHWAPTCALKPAILASAQNPANIPDPKDSLAGPEGYTVTWSTDHFEAHSTSHTIEDFSQSGFSFSACLSASAFVGTPENKAAKAGIGV